MHELTITQNILDIAVRHAQTCNAQKITDLYIVMGEWSSVVDDSVQFYWDIISDGTIAKGANLHFQRNKVKIVCCDCQSEYSPSYKELFCPNCAGINLKVIQGEEFYLDSIEVES